MDGERASGSAIRGISALTLATRDMARAVSFYRSLGFRLRSGGPSAEFTTFDAGPSALNLILRPDADPGSWWGRAIVEVDDVDAVFRRAVEAGLRPEAEPRDASWGERYFHIVDPDGHELSFAKPLR